MKKELLGCGLRFLPICVPRNLVLNVTAAVVLWGGEIVREAALPNGRLGSPLMWQLRVS